MQKAAIQETPVFGWSGSSNDDKKADISDLSDYDIPIDMPNELRSIIAKQAINTDLLINSLCNLFRETRSLKRVKSVIDYLESVQCYPTPLHVNCNELKSYFGNHFDQIKTVFNENLEHVQIFKDRICVKQQLNTELILGKLQDPYLWRSKVQELESLYKTLVLVDLISIEKSPVLMWCQEFTDLKSVTDVAPAVVSTNEVGTPQKYKLNEFKNITDYVLYIQKDQRTCQDRLEQLFLALAAVDHTHPDVVKWVKNLLMDTKMTKNVCYALDNMIQMIEYQDFVNRNDDLNYDIWISMLKNVTDFFGDLYIKWERDVRLEENQDAVHQDAVHQDFMDKVQLLDAVRRSFVRLSSECSRTKAERTKNMVFDYYAEKWKSFKLCFLCCFCMPCVACAVKCLEQR